MTTHRGVRFLIAIILFPLIEALILFARLFGKKSTPEKAQAKTMKDNQYCQEHGFYMTVVNIGHYTISRKRIPIFWKTFSCKKCSWNKTTYKVFHPFTKWGD